MPKYLTLLTAFTNKSVGSRRPITVTILSILTFAAVVPPFAEQFKRDPLEIAFVYPPRPIIDVFSYLLIDIPLFLVSIIAGIGLIKRQRWAWFVAIGLYSLVFSIHLAACITLGRDSAGTGFMGSFDGTYGRYASIAISLIAFYLLSRNDVRTYLMPLTKT